MPTDAKAFVAGQRALLVRVANGEPLPEVLRGVVELIEAHADGLICSVLMLDREHGTVHPIAAPHLPDRYTKALEGAKIGPREGSCGAAAYLGEPVIVEDIATHPNWANYKQLALPHGLRACWSTPIVSADREVMGTFAMYYREPRGPTPAETELVDIATHLTSIAIQRDRAEQSLRASEERHRELAQLYAVSSRINEAIIRVRDPEALYILATRVAVEQNLARLAWIGIQDAGTDSVVAVARSGRDDGYVDLTAGLLSGSQRGEGPAGRALSTGAAATTPDIRSDTHFPGKDAALARGLRSCSAFPFSIDDGGRGVFVLYTARVGGYSAEEQEIFNTITGNISFAVQKLRVAG